MDSRRKFTAATWLLACLFGGCIDRGYSEARDANDVSDDFDQQQLANTSPHGDGSGESGAYYGSPGPTSDPVPVRRAASPEPATTRTPASPRVSGD